MNQQNNYAFYGSLRPKMYNFNAFKSRYNDDVKVLEEEKEIEGYKLYSLGAYPYAIKTGNPADKMKVSLCKVTNSAESNVHRMEIGAGYYYDEVSVDGENYGIYLFSDKYHNDTRLVESGDWVAYRSN